MQGGCEGGDAASGYGNLWGIYDDYRGATGRSPMEYMELVYDSIAFREEHEAQITGDAGDLDGKYVGETKMF